MVPSRKERVYGDTSLFVIRSLRIDVLHDQLLGLDVPKSEKTFHGKQRISLDDFLAIGRLNRAVMLVAKSYYVMIKFPKNGRPHINIFMMSISRFFFFFVGGTFWFSLSLSIGIESLFALFGGATWGITVSSNDPSQGDITSQMTSVWNISDENCIRGFLLPPIRNHKGGQRKRKGEKKEAVAICSKFDLRRGPPAPFHFLKGRWGKVGRVMGKGGMGHGAWIELAPPVYKAIIPRRNSLRKGFLDQGGHCY